MSPTLVPFLRGGFAVVVSDYQGLGNPDPGSDSRKRDSYHPYLDSTTAGYNLIDAARAARALMASSNTAASEDWLAFGIGQGGQAAWAANELADNHGWSLKLIGAVAISPIADINGLADLAADETLNTPQKLELQAFLAGLKNAYGNDFNLDDYRSGVAQQKWDALLACHGQGQPLEARAAIADQIGPDDLKPYSAAAADTLRGYLQKTSLPQGPAQAPMLVMYGGRDPLIPPDWTAAALDRACRMGDVIDRRLLPADAMPGQFDTAELLDWMNQRVTGAPAPNNCGGGQ
jgi:pimeloyl-ACP methyl ester carboxylesterase